MSVPTLQINEDEITNLLSFIYKHERLLKEFGAIKIRVDENCKLALKKRRKNLVTCPITTQVVQMSKDELIYSVQQAAPIDSSIEQGPLIKDEAAFWLSISCLNEQQRHLNISLLPNKSFFYRKAFRLHFDIHRIPGQSLLKIAGTKVTSQYVPCVKRAHGPGSILPLNCTQQHLFSLDYHHEGGNHHWYVIPNRERGLLQSIIDKQNSSTCLDHAQIIIDPLILDKYHIRYHRIIQHPKEFVVLSAGTISQSFSTDASWSESIDFALPTWIEAGHAAYSLSSCQCNTSRASLSKIIDITLFQHELMQKYIKYYLHSFKEDESVILTGSFKYL